MRNPLLSFSGSSSSSQIEIIFFGQPRFIRHRSPEPNPQHVSEVGHSGGVRDKFEAALAAARLVERRNTLVSRRLDHIVARRGTGRLHAFGIRRHQIVRGGIAGFPMHLQIETLREQHLNHVRLLQSDLVFRQLR